VARGDKGRWLRFNIDPTRTGAMVVVLDSAWNAGRPAARERGRFDVTVDGGVSLDDPRAALLALSDALARAADNFPA
jgi:hypothetical protein